MKTVLISKSDISDRTAKSRKPFLQKVYLFLGIGLFLFSLASVFLQYTPIPKSILSWYVSSSWAYLISLGLLFAFSYVSEVLARSENTVLQKVGLVAYAGIEALFFAPLFLIAQSVSPLIIPISLGITLILFVLLSLVAVRYADTFRKWRMIFVYGGVITLAAVVLSIVFGFTLGIWFSYAMIVFIGGAILYETATVLKDYEDDQYIAAALMLLASIITLLWYVIRVVLSFFNRD
jgi:uncharacterized protein